MEISFDNTEIAFAYKSTSELKKSRFLFKSMALNWLVYIGTRLTPWALKMHLPINWLIRATIFKQFVGGETLQDTQEVVSILERYGVEVILDYGIEGMQTEVDFERAKNEFIAVIKYASSQPNIPYISIKITAFARFELLEKVHEITDVVSVLNGHVNKKELNELESREWIAITHRLEEICNMAEVVKVKILIDAEESWIQNPIDSLSIQMMRKYNNEKVVIYNTVQLYRSDRLVFLKKMIDASFHDKYLLGVKLVRGAYMEKERARATKMNYVSPIHLNKNTTDTDFNNGVSLCLDNIQKLKLIVATHNEYSNLYTTKLLTEKGMSLSHPHVHFSQLYGMSDNITFNLAKNGCSVSKYLPFGPLNEVVPYLMRRAQENSSVSGQTGRELGLIEKEILRRKNVTSL